METREKSQTSARESVVSPANSTFAGVLRGPGGPLKSWPFLLTRNGKPLDAGLGGGSSTNTFRDGCWWSEPSGEFRFTGMPMGVYAIQVLLAGGKVEPATKEPPPAEDGFRGVRPGYFDPAGFEEDPGK